jgi:glycogen synthase
LIKRVFHCTGPGNIIGSYEYWKRNEHDPSEVSVTFSSQVQDFCRDIGAEAYFVSLHAKRAVLKDGVFTLEHRPKRAYQGARYHLGEVLYGLGLLATALRFRAQVALIDSGSTHYFVLTLFRLCGIRVVPILHNTLWPSGFPPTKRIPRFVQWLDTLAFWRWAPTAVLAVSPECERQVDALRGKKRYPIFQIRAQFDPGHFKRIPPPPPHGQRPFRVIFVGRMIRHKGIFDILQIAREIEDSNPGIVRWELCGRGPDFESLSARHRELRLQDVVVLRGWTSPEDQIAVYARSHASIVPTRGSFTEGLAMTAAEAILAGRPLVTNPVVPALEVLRGACMPARTNDADSHRVAVVSLATDAALYERLRAACAGYQRQFYDYEAGLIGGLKRALAPYLA